MLQFAAVEELTVVHQIFSFQLSLKSTEFCLVMPIFCAYSVASKGIASRVDFGSYSFGDHGLVTYQAYKLSNPYFIFNAIVRIFVLKIVCF
jgi:hypothetical protein